MPTPAAGQVTDVVSVPVAGVEELGAVARQTFDNAVFLYATELLNEASLYEMQHRGSTSPSPQYTTGQIVQAEVAVRNKGLAPTARSKWFLGGRLALYVMAAISGVSVGPAWEDGAPMAWVGAFWVASAFGLGITVMLELAEHQERKR